MSPSTKSHTCLFYHHPQKKLTFKQVRQTLKQPHLSFVKAFKKSVLSSVYAFLFILGYMLIFQFFVSFLQDVFPIFFYYLKGILEFSSGSLKIIHQSKKRKQNKERTSLVSMKINYKKEFVKKSKDI